MGGEGAGREKREKSTLRQWITKTGRQEAGGQREECITFNTTCNAILMLTLNKQSSDFQMSLSS